ncbi:MAG: hypothetical protein WCA39_08565 [Nitrososphaeraceae archaeon]|jgi:hypothetical protein
MNKPTIAAVAVAAALAISVFALPSIEIAKAQYGGVTGGNIEEQLKLAREKITNAKSAGAYGSGTPMLGTNINETVLFIIILTVIFGGVAAAFFIMGRSKKKEVAR